MTWKRSISRNVGVVTVGNINNYVQSTAPNRPAALDAFYAEVRGILQASTPVYLGAHPSIGSLMFVGIISATENYFRNILSGLVEVCPLARAASTQKDVKLGSVLWHGGHGALRTAFESISFSNPKNIVKATKEYVGLPTFTETSVYTEYGKLCEIRHGIVHANNELTGKNAIALHLSNPGQGVTVTIGFAEIQECADVCTTLVVEFHNTLFELMCERWAKKWPFIGTWTRAQARATFHQVWRTFYSEFDKSNGTIPNALTMTKCLNRVCSDYGVTLPSV